MTVAELLRVLRRAKREAIVVIERGEGGGAALRGVDVAECRADVVEDDGSIRSVVAECVLLYYSAPAQEGA